MTTNQQQRNSSGNFNNFNSNNNSNNQTNNVNNTTQNQPIIKLETKINYSNKIEIIKNSNGSKILCIADIRGSLSQLNDLAIKHGATAIIHSGDFGFYDHASLSTISERTLKHLIQYSSLISPAYRSQLLSPSVNFSQLKNLLINPPKNHQMLNDPNYFALSDFPKLLSGELKFLVPVYTVWGACEDVTILEKIRLAAPSISTFPNSFPLTLPTPSTSTNNASPKFTPSSSGYSIPNLTVLDEATTRLLEIGGIKLRLFGLGGAVVSHKLFDNGSGSATIAGGNGTMWTTILQIGELVEMAQKVYDPSETRLLLSHASPGREGLISQLSLVLKIDLTISAGLHFRYGSSYNEFSVQHDPEAFRAKLEFAKKNFSEIWESVKGQVEGVIDVNQRVLLDHALAVATRVPAIATPTGAANEETAWKNCWNWNLPDAAYGSMALDIKDGRVGCEMKSEGFNFAYRQSKSSTPQVAAPLATPTPEVLNAIPIPPSVPIPTSSPAPVTSGHREPRGPPSLANNATRSFSTQNRAVSAGGQPPANQINPASISNRNTSSSTGPPSSSTNNNNSNKDSSTTGATSTPAAFTHPSHPNPPTGPRGESSSRGGGRGGWGANGERLNDNRRDAREPREPREPRKPYNNNNNRDTRDNSVSKEMTSANSTIPAIIAATVPLPGSTNATPVKASAATSTSTPVAAPSTIEGVSVPIPNSKAVVAPGSNAGTSLPNLPAVPTGAGVLPAIRNNNHNNPRTNIRTHNNPRTFNNNNNHSSTPSTFPASSSSSTITATAPLVDGSAPSISAEGLPSIGGGENRRGGRGGNRGTRGNNNPRGSSRGGPEGSIRGGDRGDNSNRGSRPPRRGVDTSAGAAPSSTTPSAPSSAPTPSALTPSASTAGTTPSKPVSSKAGADKDTERKW